MIVSGIEITSVEKAPEKTRARWKPVIEEFVASGATLAKLSSLDGSPVRTCYLYRIAKQYGIHIFQRQNSVYLERLS